MFSLRHSAPPMRMKSSAASGNSDPKASGIVTFQMNGASALNPRNSPMDATTTANGLRWPIGRMMKRSTPIATTNATTAEIATAAHRPTPPSASHQARNALIIAISPWAKFRWPDPR